MTGPLTSPDTGLTLETSRQEAAEFLAVASSSGGTCPPGWLCNVIPRLVQAVPEVKRATGMLLEKEIDFFYTHLF
jgi:hypothetical protein